MTIASMRPFRASCSIFVFSAGVAPIFLSNVLALSPMIGSKLLSLIMCGFLLYSISYITVSTMTFIIITIKA